MAYLPLLVKGQLHYNRVQPPLSKNSGKTVCNLHCAWVWMCKQWTEIEAVIYGSNKWEQLPILQLLLADIKPSKLKNLCWKLIKQQNGYSQLVNIYYMNPSPRPYKQWFGNEVKDVLKVLTIFVHTVYSFYFTIPLAMLELHTSIQLGWAVNLPQTRDNVTQSQMQLQNSQYFLKYVFFVTWKNLKALSNQHVTLFPGLC